MHIHAFKWWCSVTNIMLIYIHADGASQLKINVKSVPGSPKEIFAPTFRDHHREHGHPNAPYSYPVLGQLVASIRTALSAIPPQYEDELMGMGLDLRNQHII